MLRFLPALKIHTWGGLGSQLFALALADGLHRRFPQRRIKIVLHNGGVTLRAPEVTELFPLWKYELVSDYKSQYGNMPEKSVLKNLTVTLRSRIKTFMILVGLLATGDDDFEFSRIRPWTLDCRGHYSYRTIPPDFFSLLLGVLMAESNLDSNNYKHSFAIHYRLGDLLTLNEKNPITAESIINECKRFRSAQNSRELIVLSDSPDVAKTLFTGLVGYDLTTPEVNTIDVMVCGTASNYFLGTSSKISFWIAALRTVLLAERSSLPYSNVIQMRRMLGFNTTLIHYY